LERETRTFLAEIGTTFALSYVFAGEAADLREVLKVATIM
jgi:hypothetical protein